MNQQDKLDIFFGTLSCFLSVICFLSLKEQFSADHPFHALVHINCATLLMTDKPLVEKDVSHTR